MRTFVCAECRQSKQVDTSTGPLPSTCDDCHPDAAKRRETRARSRQNARDRKVRIRDLEAQIETLQAMLGGEVRSPSGDPGRRAVTVAIRRLAAAEGRAQTRQRLFELRAECDAWAEVLAVDQAHDAIGHRTLAA